MPADSREVHELFRREQDPQDAASLLAYAVFEEEKYEWMEHRKQQTGAYPTADEIDRWISELPEQYFQRIYNRAFRWMDEFARNLLADEIEAQKTQAIQRSIVAELRKQGGFWRQMMINTVAGFAGAAMFALLIYIVAVTVFTDVSPVGLARDALESREERR